MNTVFRKFFENLHFLRFSNDESKIEERNKRSGSLRNPRTTAELRDACVIDIILKRAALLGPLWRRNRRRSRKAVVPTSWDDIEPHLDHKSWKRYRKAQYRWVADMAIRS